MIQFLFGVPLLLVGLITIFSDGSVIWTGAIIVGIVLILHGATNLVRKRRVDRELSQIGGKWDDLVGRLRHNEPIDKIAEKYFESDGIPPIRTIQVASHIVKRFSESDEEILQALAAYITSKQLIDSDIDPIEMIEKFNFIDQIYFVDTSVTMYSEDPEDAKGIEGTLILSKGFLYFFEKKINLERGMEKLEGEIPYLSIATAGYELASELSDRHLTYFSEERLGSLKRRFGYENSMAIPLVHVSEMSAAMRTLLVFKTHYLALSGETNGIKWTYWFETSSSEEHEWIDSWIERLQLACIAEGKLFA